MSSSFYGVLKREGLTNSESGEVVFRANELEVVKYQYVAHCTSAKCNGGDREYGSVVKRNADKKDVYCRDCGSAIFFEKIKL